MQADVSAAREPSPCPLPKGEGSKGGFDGVQGLRAVAALAVAFLHVADEAGALVGTPGRAPYRVIDAVPLETGVDLFFVISGFVMVWSSWNAFGRLDAVWPFVARRLVRIVPLYWLLTVATVLVALAAPGVLSDGSREGWGYIAASFGFIPWRRADGFVQPVLRLGWTLEYEMLFYTLCACALPLRRPAGVVALLAAIGVLAAAGQSLPIAATTLVFWTDPIVLEFGLGVLVAVAARRSWRAGWPGLAVLVGVSAAIVVAQPDLRVITRGVPSALLVFCALSWRSLPGWLLLLGDASYALYLVHPFPMRAVRIVLGRVAAPPGLAVPAYLAGTMLVCVALAVALHLLVEQPILRWGRRRFQRADGGAIRE